MAEYINKDELIKSFSSYGCANVYGVNALRAIISRIKLQPTADVLSIEEAAELLGRLEPTPCELKGNEWLQEICEHKDTCADTSDKDCWLQYLKYRNKKPATDCHELEDKSDLVKVVRCKDCRFSSELESLGHYICRKDYCLHIKEDYCNKGKLKRRKEKRK